MNPQLLLHKVFRVRYIKGHQSQHKKSVKLKIKISFQIVTPQQLHSKET